MIDRLYQVYIRNVKYVLIVLPTLLFLVMVYLYLRSS